MSIGSVYYFDYKLTSGMSEILEKWEDTLEANHDEYTVIDGEEGDYGIVRYLDSNGVEMLTKVVRGGDQEDTYFTEAGVVAVRKLMLDSFNNILEQALVAGLPSEADLKAHIPPQVNVVDLRKVDMPATTGSYDLFLYQGVHFQAFAHPEKPDTYLFWSDPSRNYFKVSRDLYHDLAMWRDLLNNGDVDVGTHEAGLYDLIHSRYGDMK